MFSKDIEKKIVKQSYRPVSAIDGVKFIELKEFVDDSGSFLQLGKLNRGILEDVPDFDMKQMNYSQVYPGAIKATHIHKNQEDIWFVPASSRLLAGLKDIRKGSKTEGVVMRFVMGAGKSRLLVIPRGVAHGVSNPWNETGTIIYFVNQYFSTDEKKCDEYRLGPYFFGKDFWEIHKG